MKTNEKLNQEARAALSQVMAVAHKNYLFAKYPAGTPELEQDKLHKVLLRMQKNHVGIGPEGTEFLKMDVNVADRINALLEVIKYTTEKSK